MKFKKVKLQFHAMFNIASLQAFGHNAQFQSNVTELNKQILTIESNNNNLIAEKENQIKSLQIQRQHDIELFKEQLQQKDLIIQQKDLQIQYEAKILNEQLEKKDMLIQQKNMEIENLNLKWQIERLTNKLN